MIIVIILFFNFLLFLILILLIAIKIIIFRIQIIIFIILIIISNLSGQSFYSNNFLKKKVINNNNNNNCYYIFFHFSSLQGLPIQPRRSLNPRVVRTNLGGRICTQHMGLLGKRLRLQTLLHGSADLRLVGLQTRLLWGCSQAHRSAPSAQGWADPVLDVCWLGSWPGARGRPQRLGLATLTPSIDNLS